MKAAAYVLWGSQWTDDPVGGGDAGELAPDEEHLETGTSDTFGGGGGSGGGGGAAAVGTVGEDAAAKKKKKQKKSKKSASSMFSLGVFSKGANQEGKGPNATGTAASASAAAASSTGAGLSKLDGIPLVDPKVPAPTLKELDKVWHRIYEVVAPGMCLDLAAGERWLRRHRYAPPRFNTAALLLQYVVDSRLDETLQEILTRVSQPPLVQNPYPAVVERLRGAGHQADVSLHLDGSGGVDDGGGGGGGAGSAGAGGGGGRSTSSSSASASSSKHQLRGVAGARPRITMVQPPAPVYAARPPPGSAGAAAGAAVYGLYSAVSLAVVLVYSYKFVSFRFARPEAQLGCIRGVFGQTWVVRGAFDCLIVEYPVHI